MDNNRFHIGQRLAGFRILPIDLAAIPTAAGLSLVLLWIFTEHETCRLFALLPLVVLGHFFLFCNVFRVHKYSELLWGGIFMINFTCWLAIIVIYDMVPTIGEFWFRVIGTQTPVTIVLIMVAIFSKDYHGIGYRLVPWGRKIQILGEKENGQE